MNRLLNNECGRVLLILPNPHEEEPRRLVFKSGLLPSDLSAHWTARDDLSNLSIYHVPTTRLGLPMGQEKTFFCLRTRHRNLERAVWASTCGRWCVHTRGMYASAYSHVSDCTCSTLRLAPGPLAGSGRGSSLAHLLQNQTRSRSWLP